MLDTRLLNLLADSFIYTVTMAENVSSDDPNRIKKHAKFFKRCMEILPNYCQGLDTSRMTLLFFSLSGLDVLDAIDLSPARKSEIIDWIYAQQILPDSINSDNDKICGFRGSSFLGMPYSTNGKGSSHLPNDCSHVAMTYTALANLLILGDDLSRVNRTGVLAGVRALQQPNGSFCSTIEGSETDMRFVYCACCVSYILNDWSAVDKDRAVDYIKNSISYDYGIGQGPGLESHGGSTFCAVASLCLMDKLCCFTEQELRNTAKWCIRRQVTGFQGRPNKPPDTCYSFWIGATLELLGCGHLVNTKSNTEYVISTEGEHTGGFSKWPNCHPDPLHSYLGLCGLSLSSYPLLQPVYCPLNISQRRADWLKEIHTN